MRKILCFSMLLAGPVWPQTPVNPMNVAPETVIGIVDGTKVTAGELQYVVQTSMPQLQETLKANPMELLRYFGFAKRLAQMGEAAKLDRVSPQLERLRINRMQILAEAQLNAVYTEQEVRAEEQRKFYDENKGRYSTAKVRVIYVSFLVDAPKSADPEVKKISNEPEARAKAEGIAKQLRAGADFVKLVKQYSEHAESAAKDGDFGTIRGSDNYPIEVKKAVLGAKAGDIAGPIRLGNGFYIFRVDEASLQTYDQVKDNIYTELKDRRWKAWMDKVRAGIDIKLP